MKLKNKFLSAAMAIPVAMGGLMVSCEDTCTNCNCDNFKIEYVSAADSINTPLPELASEQVVVIRGTGLSMTNAVYLLDETGAQYAVELNPSFITDNSIIITMKSDADMIPTYGVRLTSQNGCTLDYAINKPVPSPSIKQFYSEFVPDGDTLRVYGAAFMNSPEDPLTVNFFDANDNPIPATDFKVAHENTELLIVVPSGVADSKPIEVSNSHGTATSPMLFRDTRNVFLDFDNTIASDDHGAIDTFKLAWDVEAVGTALSDHDKMLAAMGGFPKACAGDYYAAITNAGGFSFARNQMIFFAPASQGIDAVNLMGPFTGANLDGMVLKFEILVPKVASCASHFSLTFSAYGTEDAGKVCYGVYPDGACSSYYIRSLTTVDGYDDGYDAESNSFTCPLYDGVPGAWFHPAAFSTVDEDQGSATAAPGSGFYTAHQWMTVAIPLSSDYFRYNVSGKGILTADVYKACSTLKERDLCNMLLFCEDSDYQKGIQSEFGQFFFMGLDNFRIVPDDGGGVRFSKYHGATPGSKYPY